MIFIDEIKHNVEKKLSYFFTLLFRGGESQVQNVFWRQQKLDSKQNEKKMYKKVFCCSLF